MPYTFKYFFPVALLLLLPTVLLPQLADGGFVDISKTVGANPMYWRYVIVTPSDSAFGKEEPYFALSMDMVLKVPTERPHPEIALFHSSNFNTKIKRIEDQWCCSPKAHEEGLCPQVGTLNIVGVNKWTPVKDNYEIDETGTIIHWTDMGSYSYDPIAKSLRIDEKIVLNNTGMWYFFMVQCNLTQQGVIVNGIVEWRNPYGYLSGVLFPFLPLYVSLSVGLLVLLSVWIYYLIKFRANLMGLQHVITATIIIALTENILWSADYINYNIVGNIYDSINIIGALLTAGKLTVIRTLILLVALGYSITVPQLDSKIRVYVISITVVYAISNTVQQYVWVIKTMGLDFPLALEIVSGLALSITNFLYVGWVAYSLFYQYKTLKESAQTEKLSMYRKFVGALVVFFLISAVLYSVQIVLMLMNKRDEYWRGWWLWDAYWEIGYFLVVLLIGVLWWPNENNERYAYSTQIPQTRDDDDEEKQELDDVTQYQFNKNDSDDSASDKDDKNTEKDSKKENQPQQPQQQEETIKLKESSRSDEDLT